MDHAENIRDIEEKLRSFGIDARVVGTNSGPVVTQYEVRPGEARQAVPDRGPPGRPGDGPGRPLDPDRGADPGQGRGRHRDPQRQERDRRLPLADRGCRHAGGDQPADLRPRPRRIGSALRGRPGQDAPPAGRRGDRLGQERLRQRPDHEPPDACPAGRGSPDPGRPQAGRAGARTTACRTSSST